jgi:hypothetical protein
MLLFLLDPRIFSYVICALNALNAGRWALDGKWLVAVYWLCALGINVCVMIGLGK